MGALGDEQHHGAVSAPHGTYEHVDTVVVGAGQAGLAAGYYLARGGRDFLILDAQPQVGNSWRRRWDSLRLFTPACFNGLPGLAFPAATRHRPGKDEMADYLARYASELDLPLRLSCAVEYLTRDRDTYVVHAGGGVITTRNVVIASGANHRRYVPPLSDDLDPRIGQIHSSDYQRPSCLPDGPVLVVGAANSGAEIALDLATAGPATGRTVWLSGRHPGHAPFTPGCVSYRLLRRLSVDSRIGHEVARRRSGGDFVIRARPAGLCRAGVRRRHRVTGVREGRPELANGLVVDPRTIIWATGFTRDLPWLALDVWDEHGALDHDHGEVRGEPGLYVVGWPLQSSVTSDLIGGVSTDARHVVGRIRQRSRAATRLQT